MKNNYVGTLTPKPSMICRKLNYKGNIDPDSTNTVELHSTGNVSFGYDIENGEIKVELNSSNLKESVMELKKWMVENKIPFEFENASMFFMDARHMTMDDIPMLESQGFIKREVDNAQNESDNFIWELINE